ncbi:N-acetylmuramoyl-L-alanine amidase [Alphaproteobacteria bacterium]|nr:N-acetylmuramoyl-L-alanine amidase [Alphaproteobacteria bacterium]
MLNKEKIYYIVIHCSDTPDTSNLSASDIHKMHLGFGWDGIGYHNVILRNGKVESGRPTYWVGAHTYGYNQNSLGICLIGRNQFTVQQFESLKNLIVELKREYPIAKIKGHRDMIDTQKTCPNFNVAEWLIKVNIS